MKFLEADAGESVYNYLCRALDVARDGVLTLQATHNGVVIVVYPQSCIHDLCDKYDLTQKLKHSLQR
jgi:hypothetical protein